MSITVPYASSSIIKAQKQHALQSGFEKHRRCEDKNDFWGMKNAVVFNKVREPK